MNWSATATFSTSCSTTLLGRTDLFHYCNELRFEQPAQQFPVELAYDVDKVRVDAGEFIGHQAQSLRQFIAG